MNKFINYIIIFIICNYIEYNINKTIIKIYKNPIFRLLFLYLLYIFLEYDKIISLLLLICYIYIGEIIKESELLYNIK